MTLVWCQPLHASHDFYDPFINQCLFCLSSDIWSMGCVFAEMMIGHPLFPGDSGVDQLVEIIKVLGTPTREEILAMNKNYTEFKFPQVKPHPWAKVFRGKVPDEAVDFVAKMLIYRPEERLRPLEVRFILHSLYYHGRLYNPSISSVGSCPSFL